ncbi:zinc-binding dehydrogenase [Streptomyces avermitilis]|uniref:zinc-binding dehydrogenase n=1 Tax=Streptomyces avermitilis TaxID=33903 RepID=UPI0037F9E172
MTKLDAVRALGCRPRDRLHARGLAGPRRYDAIIDVAGNRSLRDLRRALTPRGRLVITGGETNAAWLGGADRQLRAQMLSPFTGRRLGTFIASECADGLRDLTALIDAGALRPVVDRVYPLTETAAAVRHLLDGRVTGKLALTLPAE